ncbi:MAG: AAA family ATPase [Actinomycetota bacterium]
MSQPHHIVLTDKHRGLPYSKGLMASSLTVSGLPIAEAFLVAEEIENQLNDRGAIEVDAQTLREMAASLLAVRGDRYAETYIKWQTVEEMNIPLVILLGGATGVGKSTVATQLATRLGITRVISTDAIREVLRSAVSEELMPTLHVSSFDADTTAASPLPIGADPVIVGFQEQVRAVAIGIKALIARALEEGTDIIVEGAHVVPGFLDGWEEEFAGAILVPIVMSVCEEDLHLSHFHMRAIETNSRPRDRYIGAFDKIRRIQNHINALAAERGVHVVDVFDLDSTLYEIVDTVVTKAVEIAELRHGLDGNIIAMHGRRHDL